jgi:DtxR family Mn-dependent transcriptional regulator
MSEEVERRLVELVSDPNVSPFGMPVPGLELLGLPIREPIACQTLIELEDGDYTLCRIGEPLQIDSQFLTQLKDLQLLPGKQVKVSKNNQSWFMSNSDLEEGLVVDNLVAQHLFLSEITQK